MNVTLEAWAARHFDPPPSPQTLRRLAREGRIQPAPKRIGRAWYVDRDAQVVDGQASDPVAAIADGDDVVAAIAASR